MYACGLLQACTNGRKPGIKRRKHVLIITFTYHEGPTLYVEYSRSVPTL